MAPPIRKIANVTAKGRVHVNLIFLKTKLIWKTVFFRGHILKIATIRKEDRGTYYCVAENGVGKGARRNIAVEVEFAPVISVPRPRLGQALQYDMDLVCHVEAYPPPALSWIKEDVQLSNNQHYSSVSITLHLFFSYNLLGLSVYITLHLFFI